MLSRVKSREDWLSNQDEEEDPIIMDDVTWKELGLMFEGAKSVLEKVSAFDVRDLRYSTLSLSDKDNLSELLSSIAENICYGLLPRDGRGLVAAHARDGFEHSKLFTTILKEIKNTKQTCAEEKVLRECICVSKPDFKAAFVLSRARVSSGSGGITAHGDDENGNGSGNNIVNVAGQKTEVVLDNAPEGTEECFDCIEGETSMNCGNIERDDNRISIDTPTSFQPMEKRRRVSGAFHPTFRKSRKEWKTC